MYYANTSTGYKLVFIVSCVLNMYSSIKNAYNLIMYGSLSDEQTAIVYTLRT